MVLLAEGVWLKGVAGKVPVTAPKEEGIGEGGGRLKAALLLDSARSLKDTGCGGTSSLLLLLLLLPLLPLSVTGSACFCSSSVEILRGLPLAGFVLVVLLLFPLLLLFLLLRMPRTAWVCEWRCVSCKQDVESEQLLRVSTHSETHPQTQSMFTPLTSQPTALDPERTPCVQPVRRWGESFCVCTCVRQLEMSVCFTAHRRAHIRTHVYINTHMHTHMHKHAHAHTHQQERTEALHACAVPTDRDSHATAQHVLVLRWPASQLDHYRLAHAATNMLA